MLKLRPAVVVLCVLLAGCGSQASQQPKMSAAATAYLNEVLDIMQRRSINRDTIDWEHFRWRMFAASEGAQTPADTHSAIRFMVSQLGDNHSRFIPPQPVNQATSTSSADIPPLPRGELLEGRIGYIWLPYLIGDGPHATTYAETVQTIIRDLDTNQPCGWIVDLSANMGGNMWPMLAGIGPVLGAGEVGRFIDPAGATTPWSYQDGRALMGQVVQASIEGTPYTLKRPDPPVAVLTSQQTASSGEAIAVAFRGRPNTRSFGQPTAGVSTGNETHQLSDGALLILTEVTFADRTGTVYGKAIEPGQRAWFGRAGQPAAMDWLLQHERCTGT